MDSRSDKISDKLFVPNMVLRVVEASNLVLFEWFSTLQTAAGGFLNNVIFEETGFPKCLVHAPKFLFLLFLKYKTILKVRVNVMYMYIHAYDDKLKCTYPKVLNTLFVFDLAMWQ